MSRFSITVLLALALFTFIRLSAAVYATCSSQNSPDVLCNACPVWEGCYPSQDPSFDACCTRPNGGCCNYTVQVKHCTGEGGACYGDCIKETCTTRFNSPYACAGDGRCAIPNP